MQNEYLYTYLLEIILIITYACMKSTLSAVYSKYSSSSGVSISYWCLCRFVFLPKCVVSTSFSYKKQKQIEKWKYLKKLRTACIVVLFMFMFYFHKKRKTRNNCTVLKTNHLRSCCTSK